MPIIDSVLMELEQEAKTTRRVLERIPEDKLGWKPHTKSFSLGQLALHIAGGQKQIANMAAQDTWELGKLENQEAKSRQELLAALDEGTASAKQTLQKMDDAKLISTWTLTKNGQTLMSVPRIGFIRAIMMNHIYHHRGQLSVYLRLLNVAVPSIYGPSADENPFAASASA
jgi:uncharacterized damage-inducible protein DinB